MVVGCGQKTLDGRYHWQSELQDEKGKLTEKDFAIKSANYCAKQYENMIFCGFHTMAQPGWWICKECAVKRGLVW